MNALVLAALLAAPCDQPPVSFRQFYADNHYRAGVGQSWMGHRTEATSTVLLRVIESQVDWLEYRVARLEKCGAPKQ